MLVHQIVSEQEINYRSMGILNQIPNGTTTTVQGSVGGQPTQITLTKNASGWVPDQSGTIRGQGQSRIRVITGRNVSGQLSARLTQGAFTQLGITPSVSLNIPRGQPHDIIPEKYRGGRVTWLEYDAEGNASRKTGTLDDFESEYKRRASRGGAVGAKYQAETDRIRKSVSENTEKWRKRYMWGALALHAYIGIDMALQYWNNTSTRKARLLMFVEAGAMTRAEYELEYKRYKRDQQAILYEGIESLGVSALVGSLFARAGTARFLAGAAKVGRAGAKLPRWSLPTLIGWAAGVAATVGLEWLLDKMEYRTFYAMFKDLIKTFDQSAGEAHDPSLLPDAVRNAEPLSQEEMDELADRMLQAVESGELDMEGVESAEDVEKVMQDFRNLYAN
jgi:YD repeat-containing protein